MPHALPQRALPALRQRRHRQATALLLTIGATTLLSACVTNTEPALPDGWKPIQVDTVPELAAMVHDSDGVLTAGTNPPFAPFEHKDAAGNIIGVEMDLTNAIAQTLGLRFQPVEQDFSLILPSISSGQVDIGASGFTDTEERRQNFDFINTLYAGIQWAQRPGEEPVDPNNACGLTVAVQRTTVSDTDDVRPKSEACVAAGKEPIEVLAYDTNDNAALAVLMGRADAFSADSPVTSWAITRADGRLVKTGELFDAAPYGIAVPQDSPLGPAIAAALQHLIETGKYQEILAQWGIKDGLVTEAMINERPVHD